MLVTSMQLRTIQIEDYDALWQCWSNEPGIALYECDTRQGIAAYLQRNPDLSVLIEVEGADGASCIIGSLLCGHDGRRGFVHHMWIAAAYRRQGLAETLFKEASARLAAIGIQKTHLFVQDANGSAQEFWHAIGCEEREDLRLFSFSH